MRNIMKKIDNNLKQEMDDVSKAHEMAQEIISIMKEGGVNSDIPQCAINNKHFKGLVEKLTVESNYSVKDINETENIDKLVRIISQKNRKKARTKRLVYAITSVASVFAVISFLLMNNFDVNMVPELMVERNEELLKPTLILSNGRDVDLMATNYHIEDKTYAIKKKAENTLSYFVKDTLSDSQNVVEYNTIIVPSKYTYSVILADGTSVTLNAGSKLKYPVRFEIDKREVFLDGEGYFKVTKDAKPFIVTTCCAYLKVYGTEFNLSSRTNSNSYDAVLVSGSIGVTIKGNDTKEIFIKPSQKLSFTKDDQEISIKEVDINNDIAWLDGYLRCSDEPLTTIIDKISLWYGVDFRFKTESIKDLNITISLDRNLSLENLLSLIEKCIDIKFIKEKGGHYSIY